MSNSNKFNVSLKKRLILIILGLIFFFVLVGLIIWSSIILNGIPSKYEKDDANYKKALTFGLINGFSDFIGLILIVNILIFSYSIKIFKLIKDWTNSKKNSKSTANNQSNLTISKTKDLNEVK